jgi:hypothetical protein
MSTRQLLRNTIYQGKCDLVGHKVSKEKIIPLISQVVDSMDAECVRCNLRLHLIHKNGKIIVDRKY